MPRVLVVDDDPYIREMLVDALESAGLEMVSAVDGLAALACLDEVPIDLILVDARMPHLDGFATCERIRALPVGRDLPLVMITALNDAASVERAFEVGADDVIFKPIHLTLLLARVRHLLQEHRQARALQASEARYRRIVETAQEGIWLVDTSWTTTYVNRRMADMLGTTVEQMVGRPARDYVVEDVFPEIPREPSSVPRYYDVRMRHLNGTILQTSVTANPVIADDGTLLGSLGMVTDRTERARAEAELHLRDQAIAATTNGLLIVDATAPDLPIIFANPAFERLTGYDASEVLGRNCRFLQGPHTDRAAVAEMREAIAAARPVVVEILNYRKDGTPFWNNLSIAPIHDPEGRLTHFVGVQQDVTARREAELAVERTSAYFRALIEHTTESTTVLNLDGSIRYASPAVAQLLGYAPEEREQRGMFELIHPDDLPDAQQNLARLVAQPGLVLEMEVRSRHRDGTWRYLMATAHNLLDDPAVGGIVVHARDVTAARQAEIIQRRLTDRLRHLHAIDQAILELRPATEIARNALRYVRQLIPCYRASVSEIDPENDAAVVIAVDAVNDFGPAVGSHFLGSALYPSADLLAGEVLRVADIQVATINNDKVAALRALGIRAFLMVPLLTDQGLIGSLNLSAMEPGVFTDEHVEIAREIAAMLAVAMHNSRLYEQVRSGRERLQRLARELVAVQEAERRHLARELHDEIGQALTAIKINLQIAQRSGKHADDEVHLAECMSIVDGTLRQVRDLSLDLHPSLLDDLGLASALRWHIDRYAQRAGLAAHLDFDLDLPRFSRALETACFRVAQEAITNVVRHAHARHLWVTATSSATELMLVVRDDGVGFDAEATLERAGRGGSLGLLSMRERAGLLGGTLTIESMSGKGTTVRASFPHHG